MIMSKLQFAVALLSAMGGLGDLAIGAEPGKSDQDHRSTSDRHPPTTTRYIAAPLTAGLDAIGLGANTPVGVSMIVQGDSQCINVSDRMFGRVHEIGVWPAPAVGTGLSVSIPQIGYNWSAYTPANASLSTPAPISGVLNWPLVSYGHTWTLASSTPADSQILQAFINEQSFVTYPWPPPPDEPFRNGLRLAVVARTNGFGNEKIKYEYFRDWGQTNSSMSTLTDGQWGVDFLSDTEPISPPSSIGWMNIFTPNLSENGTFDLAQIIIGAANPSTGGWGDGWVFGFIAQGGFHAHDANTVFQDDLRDQMLHALERPGQPVYVLIHYSNPMPSGFDYDIEMRINISAWRDASARTAIPVRFVLVAPWLTGLSSSWMEGYRDAILSIQASNTSDTAYASMYDFFGGKIPDTVDSIKYKLTPGRVHPTNSSAANYASVIGSLLFTSDTPDCPADLTGDGTVDAGDLGAFITLYLASDLLVDFTGDGVVDAGDLSDFIAHYLAGC